MPHCKQCEKKASIQQEIYNESPLYSRILDILNRNIVGRYDFNQIQSAFRKDPSIPNTPEENFIFDRFFKECDLNDLDDLIKVFSLERKNIIEIYKRTSTRDFIGVAKVWDKEFGLKTITPPKPKPLKMSKALKKILIKRRIKQMTTQEQYLHLEKLKILDALVSGLVEKFEQEYNVLDVKRLKNLIKFGTIYKYYNSLKKKRITKRRLILPSKMRKN